MWVSLSQAEWRDRCAELKAVTAANNQLVHDMELRDRRIEHLTSEVTRLGSTTQQVKHVAKQTHQSAASDRAELQRLQAFVEHQRATIDAQESRVQEAERSKAQEADHRATMERQYTQLVKEIEVKNHTVAHLHDRHSSTDDQMRAVERLHHRSQKTCTELDACCKELERRNSELVSQFTECQAEVEDFKQIKNSHRTLQSEVDRVKTDNARLVKMLSQTSEFRSFVERTYNMTDVAYIKQGSPLKELRIITDMYENEQATGRVVDQKSEFAHWMPADIYHFGIECRERFFPGSVSDDAFGAFMHAMHMRWRAHEQRMLNKLELRHDREKRDLQRKLVQGVPYDVARLQDEVQSLKSLAKRQSFQKTEKQKRRVIKVKTREQIIEEWKQLKAD